MCPLRDGERECTGDDGTVLNPDCGGNMHVKFIDMHTKTGLCLKRQFEKLYLVGYFILMIFM